ncbi:SAM-dependent methyltransferase [Aureimonas sp. Leaf460]|uniref:class I SAM-dependent methyltransferase n=1 Tax=Aureimonas sp. Leaf460 TaxID=1736384 RepID=UPI0006FA74BD|nr:MULTISPECIES: class I SAM-dependent methyltransferase [unclassified Aureimonas]KQT64333.1 SAM-dependent methyltransferase [Aureimonas sp. Leaf427]KQT81522.1 SAM-dependent methyltransferase [Aureimonas sp. Leaf460]
MSGDRRRPPASGPKRPPRDAKGSGRAAAPRETAFRDGPPREKPAREAPRERPVREEPRDEGAVRETAPREEGARRTPPPRREGARPAERLPVILTVEPDADYALLDCGDGEKLERYGPLTVRRPENQAIWPRLLPERAWEAADAVFTGDTDEEGSGRWRFPKVPLGETWPLAHRGLSYLGRFTSYRHVGVFPEQASHWAFMTDAIEASRRPVRVLNLFGYTGLASLLAARAGAEVTHVDASKKAIGWARENAELAGLTEKPVRWLCEDAVRYVEREVKRGSRYDIILLDPPRFGRGPKGEVWQLFEDLPHLLDQVRQLVSDRPIGVILTAYSIRASFYSLSALMAESFRGMGGTVESGELVIREDNAEPRLLSTSLFSRWKP